MHSAHPIGIEYPVRITQLERVERQNDLGINVFRLWKDDKVAPFRKAKDDVASGRLVNLLQLTSETGYHFVLITDLHRLLCCQISPTNSFHLCHRCFYTCLSDALWSTHQALCANQKTQEIRLPPKNCPRKTVKFSYLLEDGLHASRVKEIECPLPFAIFADVECILEPAGGSLDQVGSGVQQIHRPIAVAYAASR